MDGKYRNLQIRAYKNEKNPVTKDRIHAVRMIKINGLEPSNVALLCYRDQRTIDDRIRRFGGDGPTGLNDRPGSGKPSRVGTEGIGDIVWGRATSRRQESLETTYA